MPIDLSWYVPNRVVHVHIYGEAGLEQLEKLMNDIQPYLEAGIAPVHIILDDATANPPPISIKELKSVMDMGKNSMNKLGWVIGIGDVNIIAKVVIPMLAKVVRIKHMRVDTREDAIAILKRQDLSLSTEELENL